MSGAQEGQKSKCVQSANQNCGTKPRRKRVYRAEMIGVRYGRLLVVSDATDLAKYRHPRSLCVCDCGKTVEIQNSNILNGHTKSCGCYNKELSGQRKFKHGKSKTKMFKVWASMVQRCTNPNDQAYPNYGGRGIKVCSRWAGSFEFFIQDMGDRPQGMDIDRINNEGGYEPGNCRWVSRKTNSRNTRKTVMVELGNVRLPLIELSEILNVPYGKMWGVFKRKGQNLELTLKRLVERGEVTAHLLDTPEQLQECIDRKKEKPGRLL